MDSVALFDWRTRTVQMPEKGIRLILPQEGRARPCLFSNNRTDDQPGMQKRRKTVKTSLTRQLGCRQSFFRDACRAYFGLYAFVHARAGFSHE